MSLDILSIETDNIQKTVRPNALLLVHLSYLFLICSKWFKIGFILLLSEWLIEMTFIPINQPINKSIDQSIDQSAINILDSSSVNDMAYSILPV